MTSLKINSFNARGLGNDKKRRSIFHWLKHFYKGICLLQETHSTPSSVEQWEKEWGGNIVFNHGTNKSKGVAILFPSSINVDVNQCLKDNEGGLIVVDIDIAGQNMIIGNIYAPTQDNEDEQIMLIEQLNVMLNNFQDRNIILGGDFNVYIDPKLDKKGGNLQKISRYSTFLSTFNESTIH